MLNMWILAAAWLILTVTIVAFTYGATKGRDDE